MIHNDRILANTAQMLLVAKESDVTSRCPTALHRLPSRLVSDGRLVPMGVDGLYGRGTVRSSEVSSIGWTAISPGRRAHRNAELFRFPRSSRAPTCCGPTTSDRFPTSSARSTVSAAATSRHPPAGPDRPGWRLGRQRSEPTDVVLLPAACYPLYPMVSGALPEGGRVFDVLGTCFRHEPSTDPARMQIFHRARVVHIGSPGQHAGLPRHVAERAIELMRERLGSKPTRWSPMIPSSDGPVGCSRPTNAPSPSSSRS